MQPPVGVERAVGLLGQVVVALHDVGAAQQHLVALADLDLGAGQGPADGADPVLVRVVDRAAGGVLGHAVALEDHDAGGVEPLGDLPVERGGAGDEEPHASTEPLAHLAEHQLVEEAVLDLQRQRDGLALALELLDLEADLERLVEDLLLGAALGGLHGLDPAVGLLEDARGGAHEGRLHRGAVVDDLVDAAVDGGGEAARELGRQQHLAERVGHRQPQELQVGLVEDVLGADGLALEDPRLVAQPYALGAAGGAGGVDQGRELVGRDRLGRGPRRRRAARRASPPELGQVVERDDPVAVGRAVEGHDLADVRQLGAVVGQLLELLVVLGEDDVALGVGEDVDGVLGVGARVDRGGRAGGAHHREVGQDPLVAGAGGDADALLGLDAQRDQAGGQRLDLVADLLPGDGLPCLPRGKRKASLSGDVATRSKNWTATLAGIVSRKAVSKVVGICYLLIRRSVTRPRHTAGGKAARLGL